MKQSEHHDPSRPIVLVVDDEAAIRVFVCEYLRDCGFHAMGLECADDAIALLERGIAADLVFSDVRMPGRRDGFGLAKWIAEHRPELPVILTTGDIGKENAAAMLCHTEMLSKPYELDLAVERMHRIIEQHRTMRLN